MELSSKGEEDAIESLIKEIRALDPAGIFIKDRGFPIGDPRRCRGDASGSPCKLLWITSGRRSGSVRPGSYMIEAESKMLPLISRALGSFAQERSRDSKETTALTKKRPLDVKKLEEAAKGEIL